MIHTKLGFRHRVGNTIQSLINIAENIVAILTFSYFMPNWVMKFMMWRLKTKIFYGSNNKKEVDKVTKKP